MFRTILLTSILASVAILVGSAVLRLSHHAAPAHAQLKIGIAGPMTGANAIFGTQLRNGAEEAIAAINARGGVEGKPIQAVIGDDACDPRQAVSVANDMASREVSAVIGHFCSSSSIPASKVYAEEEIVEISPASTSPIYTERGEWNVFRTCGRDDEQGKVAGQYIATHFADRNIAVLNDNSAYGKGLAGETQKAMQQAGKTPTLVSAYVPGERDYSALVSRMKMDNIGVIYIGGYQTEAGLIARQASSQGLKAVIMGGDALATTEFWQIAGQAGEGTMMTFPADPRNLPSAAQAVANFQAHGINPEGYVLYSYAAMQAWAQAAEKAGAADARHVAQTLKSGQWDTVLGRISFNEKGDISNGNYVLYVWKNGNYAQM